MRLFSAVAVMLVLVALPAAAGSVEGALVDNMCYAKMKTYDKIQMHTKQCALGCKGSGFAVVTQDGKVYKLDDSGNEKAVAALGETDKEKGINAKVDGKIEGDTIAVKSLEIL